MPRCSDFNKALDEYDYKAYEDAETEEKYWDEIIENAESMEFDLDNEEQ